MSEEELNYLRDHPPLCERTVEVVRDHTVEVVRDHYDAEFTVDGRPRIDDGHDALLDQLRAVHHEPRFDLEEKAIRDPRR